MAKRIATGEFVQRICTVESTLTEVLTRMSAMEKKMTALIDRQSLDRRTRLRLYDQIDTRVVSAKIRPKSAPTTGQTISESPEDGNYVDITKTASLKGFCLASLINQFAENVTGIIGLQETVAIKHPILKGIWLALFVAAIGATIYFVYQTIHDYLEEPTVTRMKLQAQANYDYPPIVLCHDGWYDVGKMKNMGLSEDGLKFGLSYITKDYGPKDTASGKADFESFYRKQKYESLLHFYEAITTDLKTVGEYDKKAFEATLVPVYYTEPKIFPVDKVFVPLQNSMCYRFNLSSLDATKGVLYDYDDLFLKFEDRTQQLFMGTKSDWRLYLSTNADAVYAHPLFLKPSMVYSITITTKRIINMDSSAARCSQNQFPSADCYSACLNELLYAKINCNLFFVSKGNQELAPSEFCNLPERLPNNKTMADVMNEAEDIFNKTQDVCFKRCPRECDRTFHDAKIQGEYLSHDAEKTNLSFSKLRFLHDAMREGGVMYIIEVPSLTFTELMNNVGGTLGLFIGGTLMTFAQIILFFINYIWDKKRARDVSKVGPVFVQKS